jgi:hypothetical protein
MQSTRKKGFGVSPRKFFMQSMSIYPFSEIKKTTQHSAPNLDNSDTSIWIFQSPLSSKLLVTQKEKFPFFK